MRDIHFIIKYFFFTLLFSMGYSQNNQGEKTYNIQITNLNYRINRGVENNTDDSKIEITIHYQNGTNEKYYTRNIRNRGDNESNLNLNLLTKNKIVKNIEVYAFVNFRTGTDAKGSKYININSDCQTGKFDESFSPRMSHITFDYKIFPNLIISDPNPNSNFLPTDDKIKISSLHNFNSNEYKWQYKTNEMPLYTNLEQFNEQDTILVAAFDILGINTDQYLNQVIFIRQLSNCGNWSNIVQYTVSPSAPKITPNSDKETYTSCFDSKDGKIRVFFDRPLNSSINERINLKK